MVIGRCLIANPNNIARMSLHSTADSSHRRPVVIMLTFEVGNDGIHVRLTHGILTGWIKDVPVDMSSLLSKGQGSVNE